MATNKVTSLALGRSHRHSQSELEKEASAGAKARMDFAKASFGRQLIEQLFSHPGHKFHNVLRIDLRGVEEDVLPWSHLDLGDSSCNRSEFQNTK